MLHLYAIRLRQVTVFELSLKIHLKDSFKISDLFKKETYYEWVSESFIQTIYSKTLIHSVRKQVTAFISESFNRSLNRFVQKHYHSEIIHNYYVVLRVSVFLLALFGTIFTGEQIVYIY